jgi:hypothetical protein
MLKNVLCAAAAALMLSGSQSHSAEISCAVPNYEQQGFKVCPSGLLKGKIVKGDFKTILLTILANGNFPASFILISPGGDVDEALEIGRLFRKWLIQTYAPMKNENGTFSYNGGGYGEISCTGPDCTCVSACALIWFGGINRSGTVGLHRPYLEDQSFKNLPPDQASPIYNQMMNKVVAYLNEMEVPKSIMEAMTSTSSGSVRWVDWIDDFLLYPPSIAEWVDASCGRGDPYVDALRENFRLPSQQWEALKRQHHQKKKCEDRLIHDHRTRVARVFFDELKKDLEKSEAWHNLKKEVCKRSPGMDGC